MACFQKPNWMKTALKEASICEKVLEGFLTVLLDKKKPVNQRCFSGPHSYFPDSKSNLLFLPFTLYKVIKAQRTQPEPSILTDIVKLLYCSDTSKLFCILYCRPNEWFNFLNSVKSYFSMIVKWKIDSEVCVNIINIVECQIDTSQVGRLRICRVQLLGNVCALGQVASPCGFFFMKMGVFP